MQNPLPFSPDSINPRDLTLLGQGRTAEVFLLGEGHVLKLFRANFPKQAIENEYLVCRSIASMIDIPTAHQHLIVAGRDAIVFDRIIGVSGFKHLLRTPWSIGAFAREFAAIHVRMHALTVPSGVPALKDILIRNINLHELLSAEKKGKIIGFLRSLPDGNALCHGDFHPENILISREKTFVLDWMTATRGNPLADVARTSALFKWAEPGPGVPGIMRVLLAGMRKTFHRHYMNEYLRLTGARREEIEQWELPVLAARLMEWLPATEKQVLSAVIDDKLKKLGID